MRKYRLLLLILSLSAVSYPQLLERQALFTISGQITDSQGHPVPNASIRATPDFLTGRAPSTTTGKDGKFELGAYKGGRWMVSVSIDSLPSTANPFFYPDEKLRPFVILEDGKGVPPVIIRIPGKPGMLRLRATDDASQKPLTSARIRLCRLESPNYCNTLVRKASNGFYEVPAAASPFVALVSVDGYDDGNEVISNGVPFGEIIELSLTLKKQSSSHTGSLPAPEIISPRDGTEFFERLRLTRAEWTAVPGAASYDIDLEFCDAEVSGQGGCSRSYPFEVSRNPPTSHIVGTSYEFTFLGAQPGRWRVWAVDKNGHPGAKSQWYTFFYRV